ncbi:MAG: hypothetical protein JSV62_15915 [Promethearchaeota archaeon]|nr:MAG: hypothetical protein JSV62_15915 [Candidatus Lokiarchaeota archaeon]
MEIVKMLLKENPGNFFVSIFAITACVLLIYIQYIPNKSTYVRNDICEERYHELSKRIDNLQNTVNMILSHFIHKSDGKKD